MDFVLLDNLKVRVLFRPSLWHGKGGEKKKRRIKVTYGLFVEMGAGLLFVTLNSQYFCIIFMILFTHY